MLNSLDELTTGCSRVLPHDLYHFLEGFESCPGGIVFSYSLPAGNEAHGGVLGAHLGGSQTTPGLLEDAAKGWQVETTIGLWEVQSMGSSTPGETRPAFQESCCCCFKVLNHPGDGEIGDGHLLKLLNRRCML